MRYLVGLLIVVFGLGLLLDSLGVAQSDTLLNVLWPSFVIAVGLLSWRSNPRIWFGPLVIVLIGVAFLLESLDVFGTNWWNAFWPVIIILIGIRILVGRERGEKAHESQDGKSTFVAFSGVEKHVTGSFAGGTINAVFGGAKLDLRDAEINDGATVSVFAAFGGADVLVPKSVRVDTDVLPLFGGASNKTHPDEGASRTLRVRGTALFGGVDVKNG